MSSYDEQELKQNIVNILTEEQLRTMELEGTVPPNQDFFTEEDLEDMNLDCLRTKVLWTLDEGLLTTNFSAKEITLEDDGYDFLEIRYRYSTAHNIERSDTIRAIAGTQGLLTFVNTPDFIFRRLFILTTRSVITFAGGFQGTGTTEKTHDGVCIPISITGYYKSPAMVYTGKELHESDCISIKDGVISVKEKEMFLLTHPINSYFITEDDRNPIDVYGGGWIKIQGKFLLGADGSTYKVGDVDGGSPDAVVVDHTHNQVKLCISNGSSYNYRALSVNQSQYNSDVTSDIVGRTGGATGGTSGTGKNMPPYHIVNIWKRVS